MLRVVGLVLTTAGTLALGASVTRQFITSRVENFRRFYGSVFVFQALFVIVLVVGFEIAGPWLFERLFRDIAYEPYGRVVVMSSMLAVLPVIPRSMIFFEEKPRLYLALVLGSYGATAAISLYLVAVERMGVMGLFYGELASLGLMTPVYGYLISKRVEPSLDGERIRKALAYSLPLVPHTLSHLVLSSADRYVIQMYHDNRSVGLYGIAYVFGIGMTTLSMAFSKALAPFIFRSLKRCDEVGGTVIRSGDAGGDAGERAGTMRELGTGITAFLAGVLLSGLAIAVLAPDVIRLLMPKSYEAAIPLVPWIVCGTVAHGSYLVAVNVLFYYKRTVLVAVISVSCAVLNVLLNLWLVPRWGPAAAASTTFVAYVLLAGGVFLAARASMRLPYEWENIGILTVTVAAAAGAAVYMDAMEPAGLRIVLKTLLVGGAAAVIVISGVVPASLLRRRT
jgi:O-antigen/teichoic acid export membrane protein